MKPDNVAGRDWFHKRKAPPDDGAKEHRVWGPTCNKPHPFTFASQHVRIGAPVGRFWDITLSGMTRCHPRVVPSLGPPCASMVSDHSLRRGRYLCRSIHSICSASSSQFRATSWNARFMGRLLVCAARFLASTAFCRYSSDRDDMQGEHWKDASVPQSTSQSGLSSGAIKAVLAG